MVLPHPDGGFRGLSMNDRWWPVSDLRSRRPDASFSTHLQSSSALQRKDSGRVRILLDDF